MTDHDAIAARVAGHESWKRRALACRPVDDTIVTAGGWERSCRR